MTWQYTPSKYTAGLISAAALIILLLPSLVQQGMFLDGVTYAAISNNLSQGIGEFWKPYYSATLYPEFYEHPPLVFGIQSLFFKLFGNGYLTEGLYSLFSAILTVVAIRLIWKFMTRGTSREDLWWFPVLLWLITPVISWSYRNNLLENSLSFFCIFSVYFLLHFFENRRWYWLLLAALFIDLAFLSKGPVGLFPLALPFFFRILKSERSWKKAIIHTGLLLIWSAGLIMIYSLIDQGILDNLKNYFSHQVLPSLEGKREITTSNRFMILAFALRELIPVLILCGILFFCGRKAVKEITPLRLQALLMILLGMSAVLPLMISMKQRSFYLVPAIPFLVMGCCLFAVDALHFLLEKIRVVAWKWIHMGILCLTLAGLLFSGLKFGDYRRDEVLLKDIQTLREIVSTNTILSSPANLATNWQLQAYLARFNNQCLDENPVHAFYLVGKGSRDARPCVSTSFSDPRQFIRVDAGMAGFDLYRMNQKK